MRLFCSLTSGLLAGVLLGNVFGPHWAAAQIYLPPCWEVSSLTQGCSGCQDTHCSTCANGACNPGSYTVCFNKINWTRDISGNFRQDPSEQPCFMSFACLVPFPCAGNQCIESDFQVGSSVDTFTQRLPGGLCPGDEEV
jgi:hypothetical protein